MTDKLQLQHDFEQLIRYLSKVPNVTPHMLEFNGSETDMGNLGYYFGEGIIDESSDIVIGGSLYILGNVLEHLGFEWHAMNLHHPVYGIHINLDELKPGPSPSRDSVWDRVFECLDSVKVEITRKRILGSSV